MKSKPYKKYKPSGVDWLGDVPEHWEVKPVWCCFKKIGSGGTPDSNNPLYYDGSIPWVTTSELRENIIIGTLNHISEIALKKYPVLKFYPENTLLFAMYGATIGRLGILGIPATVNQACCAFTSPSCVETKYVFYWFQYRKTVLEMLSQGGGQPNLSQNDLRKLRIHVPHLSEQQAIAAYLDRETSKIDGVVAKKRELIERLKEKRTALISALVTGRRTVDGTPYPSYKPTGIDWLGNVPEHWEVKRLRFLLKDKLKYGANESSEESDHEQPRYVRITDIDEKGNLRPETFRSLPSEIAHEYILQDGDVLFARSGATAGKTFLYRRDWGECAYAGYLIRARLKQTELLPAILRYFADTTEYWQWISAVTIQATIQNVSAEKYIDIFLPIGDIFEQQAIAEYLDRETSKIDALITKVEEAVERLQEYRTALISAVVTGKIDIRNEVNK